MKKEMKTTQRPLTTYEHNVLLPILIKGLEKKRGKENAVTNKQIVQGLRNNGLKSSVSGIGRLINHIRVNDLVVGLMGSAVGYYISEDEHDFIVYEHSLKRRENVIKKVRLSMTRQREAMFSKDLPRQTQLF